MVPIVAFRSAVLVPRHSIFPCEEYLTRGIERQLGYFNTVTVGWHVRLKMIDYT